MNGCNLLANWFTLLCEFKLNFISWGRGVLRTVSAWRPTSVKLQIRVA